jgi:MYXO-CTERM domain-containing protein
MQFSRHLKAGAFSLALLSVALPAHAHICLEAPASRVGPNCTSAAAQKPGPCGINTRSTKYVTECRPGQTLTVILNETINHDSHYRIAFNPNGATFEDPTSKDDKDGKHPFVLLDGIKDESAPQQSMKVTLPDMPCDNCTLQLIQVMYDKTGNGFGNDDIYYACADIVLKGTSDTGECTGKAGDVVVVDAGSAAPKPATDSGAAQEPLPFPGSDAGAVATDAGSSGSGSADSAIPASAGGAGAAQDAGAHGHDDDDEGDGGCTVATHGQSRERTAPLALLLALMALIHRRRRRG